MSLTTIITSLQNSRTKLTGCITEGDTIEEVMSNLKDAMVGWLDVANSRETIASPDKIVEIVV